MTDEYAPERERQIQTEQDRYERSMSCGIDPWDEWRWQEPEEKRDPTPPS